MDDDSDRLLASLPARYWDVQYVYERHPGAPGSDEIARGANCQLYAYSVLAHFSLTVPPYRSSELWADATGSITVSDYQPLDLLLFNRTREPYGAHVAVHFGPDEILHLCREVGKPALWAFHDFAARPNYQVLIGGKRVRHRSH